MALAFKRACADAEKAMTGYYSHFKDYCGMDDDVPISFDWDSAKAVEGSSKHNSNNEELPKCVTMAKFFVSNPNYVTFMARGVGSKASAEKELAYALQKKHFNKIVVHFDEKSPKKGECTWDCEVKDGVLHATMHWNFDQYMGRPNYEDVCVWLENYLDEKEALTFEIEKARMIKDHESGSNYRYFNSDGVKYVDETLGKDIPFEYNWDEIKATPGKTILYSNKPPVMNNYLLVYNLNDGRAMYVVRDVLGRLLADDMGKEAFGDAFNKIRIRTTAGPKHAVELSKDGKTLVFHFIVKMDDHQNSVRGVEAKELAKKLETLL